MFAGAQVWEDGGWDQSCDHRDRSGWVLILLEVKPPGLSKDPAVGSENLRVTPDF